MIVASRLYRFAPGAKANLERLAELGGAQPTRRAGDEAQLAEPGRQRERSRRAPLQPPIEIDLGQARVAVEQLAVTADLPTVPTHAGNAIGASGEHVVLDCRKLARGRRSCA